MKIDVIVVPDFEGPCPLKFEYTTSLFLASWLEHGSHLSGSQLHVVSVGEMPDGTRRLAEWAGAEITVCAPFPGDDRFRNKLNGFKANPTSDHFMLLDTDVVLFRPIDQIASRLDPGCIALHYAADAHLSLAQWRAVYGRLGLPMPQQRVPMLRAAFGSWIAATVTNPLSTEFSATAPYYNGGVVVGPWSSGLATQWERLIDEVPRILLTEKREEEPNHEYAFWDQPPLAIASETVRSQGENLRILPDALHARHHHFALGLTTTDDVFLAHLTGMFSDNAPLGLHGGIGEYSARLLDRANRFLSESQGRRMTEWADHLERYLLMLCGKWIDSAGELDSEWATSELVLGD